MWMARASAFVLWALAAGLGATWSLRLFAPTSLAPADAVVVGVDAPRGVDWSRLFGADAAPTPAAVAPPPAAASRFQLVGLVGAQGAGAPGVVLMSVDGSPARAYRVGAPVDASWVVQRVGPREVALGPAGGDAAVTLQATALPPPQSDALPPALPPPTYTAPAFTPRAGPSSTAPASPRLPPQSATPPAAPTRMPAAPAAAPTTSPSLPDAFRRAAAGLPTEPQPLPAAPPGRSAAELSR